MFTLKELLMLLIVLCILVIAVFFASNANVTGMVADNSGMQSIGEDCINVSVEDMQELRDLIEERAVVLRELKEASVWPSYQNDLPSEGTVSDVGHLWDLRYNLMLISRFYYNISDEVKQYGNLYQLLDAALGKISWTNTDPTCISAVDLTELKAALLNLEWILLTPHDPPPMTYELFGSPYLSAQTTRTHTFTAGRAPRGDPAITYDPTIQMYTKSETIDGACYISNYAYSWFNGASGKVFEKCFVKIDELNLTEANLTEANLTEAKIWILLGGYNSLSRPITDVINPIISIGGQTYDSFQGGLVDVDLEKLSEFEIIPANQDVTLTTVPTSSYPAIGKGFGGNSPGIFVKVFDECNDIREEVLTDKTIFIVPDTKWEDVLSLVPVAKDKYPLLIYHREGDNFDADSILYFIEQYKSDKIIVGDMPSSLSRLVKSRAGNAEVKSIKPEDYSKLFGCEDVVYVEKDYKLALQTAQYAAYKNAQLIVKGSDLDIEENFKDRNVVLVGDVICPANSKCEDKFSDVLSLQKEIIKLIEAKGGKADKVILVNPNDINEDASKTENIGDFTNYPNRYYEELHFETENGQRINKLYYQDSLAAPILAIAKNERMVFTEQEAFSFGLNDVVEAINPITFTVDRYENIYVLGRVLDKTYLLKLDEDENIVLFEEIPAIIKKDIQYRMIEVSDDGSIFLTTGKRLFKYDPQFKLVKIIDVPSVTIGKKVFEPEIRALTSDSNYLYAITNTDIDSRNSYFLKYDFQLNKKAQKETKILLESVADIAVTDDFIGLCYFIPAGDIKILDKSSIKELQTVQISDHVSYEGTCFEGFASDSSYFYSAFSELSPKRKILRIKINKEVKKEEIPIIFTSKDTFKVINNKIYLLSKDLSSIIIYTLNGEEIKKISIGDGTTDCHVRKEKYKELEPHLETIANEIKEELKSVQGAEYLTVIASPRAIPLSKHSGCHFSGAEFRNSFDKEFLNIPTGRIFGISVSDTSSYIARAIFYKDLGKNLINNVLLIAHSFDNFQLFSPQLAKALEDGGYNTKCFIENEKFNDNEECNIATRVPQNDYIQSNYIHFDDHGHVDRWTGTLTSDNIRSFTKPLDFPIGVGDACLTTNYYQSTGGNLFGVNWLRKGGLVYFGSGGITMNAELGTNIPNLPKLILEGLFEKNLDLGHALYYADNYWKTEFEKIREKIYDTLLEQYKDEEIVKEEMALLDLYKHTIILGDPTLDFEIKQVSVDIQPPKADAGENIRETLKGSSFSIKLDASKSSDDSEIVKYEWYIKSYMGTIEENIELNRIKLEGSNPTLSFSFSKDTMNEIPYLKDKPFVDIPKNPISFVTDDLDILIVKLRVYDAFGNYGEDHIIIQFRRG